jgi:hypothetical protein
MYMEAMLGISLYSYPYVKLGKMLCLSYYCLCFLFNKIGEEGRTGSAWNQGGRGEIERVAKGGEVRGRNGPNNVCTHEFKKKFITEKKLF